ncbi:hypothetical protein [Hyphomicrobium sp. ghe19]|uniref:hypothetical protein n=1 Tax=Hyphomicrobium sp. ghe19 TaxID=2682968 RepID=UPI0013672EDE|nr:hypothetical protein HYPP_04086 [Hyphomicrobium sp. ghe19]
MKKTIGSPSHRLTFEDAVKIWLLSWAGELQSRIAAQFDVNGGRVNEVLKEHRHRGSRQEALLRLKKSA